MKKKNKKKTEFSKSLLIQETILIWVLSLCFIGISIYCIFNQYIGDLAWLATAYAFPWTAYGVSQAFYYKKAEKENIKGGIKYESVMSTVNNLVEKAKDSNDEAVG